ncbi:MAG: hypothetical protein UT98_C0001G0057 [Candidatus Nomurabacteria bacterium GW2011_GWF2_40_31]|uniref:Uncharacterized protein n=2 Tax=Candidatus Nomuraibacteriota TaxID=1752729 RepID=A0A837HTT6_9BACT|nr:MAG: hypothetical protein UT27_C0011G0010 [Candidatus Nomurabacteria bacterium GW2011_GWD2_39_12]KKR20622.1 MAG: hypothetical protein UT51_C0002G0057 [Candidatus Nomurabacteria bacterium GW2011_GWC2_39_41]KKR37449.1 MAG: hypothetical protein UT70_C0001G0125 [Candidatus Nomurabacteria bacterium GW2011_GWE2_40_10]KKR38697.1 MAG: hypothetical protein UT73_C0002G0182 [Candidatus Nomurabacteria bacterium GW2011_GWB1_40_11]KKR40422.1 MAG: hypothetical protein UT74_C0001G0156 [Parcubacteria group b
MEGPQVNKGTNEISLKLEGLRRKFDSMRQRRESMQEAQDRVPFPGHGDLVQAYQEGLDLLNKQMDEVDDEIYNLEKQLKQKSP